MVNLTPNYQQGSIASYNFHRRTSEDSNFVSFRPLPKMMKKTSDIRHSRSFNALDEHRQYDVRIGYARKKDFKPLSKLPARKARIVTFYRNGDAFYAGTRVSIQPGRDFKNLNNLCDFLTERTKLPQGVRYIFSLEGKKINDLDELLDGRSYVVSGVKTFQQMSYGEIARMRTAQAIMKPSIAPMRPDDLKLFRPLSPNSQRIKDVTPDKKNTRNKLPSIRGSGATSLPGSRDSCIITVVSNYDPATKSRVLLNLRTSQSFEDVLEDLGQAIKIKKATRMLTPWGEEVRSFSQLKNDFYELETFYLDSGDSNPPGRGGGGRLIKNNDKTKKGRTARLSRSNSAPKLDVKPKKRNSRPKPQEDEPEDDQQRPLRVRVHGDHNLYQEPIPRRSFNYN